MNRSLLSLVSARLACLVCALAVARPGHAGDADADVLASIRVPEGFTVERVAAAPLVEHPIMAGFDPQGRLYVAENAGVNLEADALLEQRPNSIRRLSDDDGDGVFDRATTFAADMTFPQGAAWFRGALYVASPPEIWRLEDTDDDGVADRRTQLVQKFGFTGNAADIHGCFVTPTGRIAWCDGRHGHEFTNAQGETTSRGLAARVFSCLPDGSDLEVFCGGGMDNPVELAFTREGEPLGTMTFYNPDDQRHDALVHFVYGGVYPKKHPCTSEFKRTGPLMPAVSRFGVTAPSGLARYDSSAWGEDYVDNVFSTHFNTHKVVRHVLTRSGATFTARDEDFLVSTNRDFHPTDVLVDADGSLLVVDTGGWFRIGCPTSQLARPEIGGAIYRVRRSGAKVPDDPRGRQIDWQRLSDIEMADLLADGRPAVVEQAIERLVPRGDAAMGALATALFEPVEYQPRQHAIFALARIGSGGALPMLRIGLNDDHPLGRLAAVKAVGDLRDRESLQPLIDLLATDEPPVRREAATALGRLRQAAAVPALLAALEKPVDRFEEHALIFALIEINDRASTLAGLEHASSRVRRAALLALDQMDAGNLTRELVEPLLAADDPALLGAVVDVLSARPAWSEALEAMLAARLAAVDPSSDDVAMVRGAVEALAAQPAVRRLVGAALAGAGTAKALRLALLEALAVQDDPDLSGLAPALRPQLGDADLEVLSQAIVTSKALAVRDPRAAVALNEPLVAIGLDRDKPDAVRIAALAAAKSAGPLSGAGFDFLVAQFEGDEHLADRLAAAEALGSFRLDAAQQRAVAPLLARANPLEASWLLRAFEGGSDGQAGAALVSALAESPAASSLSPERLRAVLGAYPAAVRAAAETLIRRVAPDDRQRVAQLAALADAASRGDAARGEEVFFSERAACAACHRIGSRGEAIGPDLSKIGDIRTRRDLAEAILLPSASLARGYESARVATTTGQTHSGLVTRQTAAAVYLRTADRDEIRIPRGDIDEMVPSATSIMPQGLDKSLGASELADLVAFLESLRGT